MGFKCGIVGLPNVGKSTLFNKITNISLSKTSPQLHTTRDSVNWDVRYRHEVISFIFNTDREKDIEKNKQAAGFALNKLILAYKNKPGFLEKLATYSNASIVSMFMTVKQLLILLVFVSQSLQKLRN